MDSNSSAFPSQFVDITAFRTCGIFPTGKEPSIRTLREWTRRRQLPHHRVGHFIYYDPTEVALHIRKRMRVPARGEGQTGQMSPFLAQRPIPSPGCRAA